MFKNTIEKIKKIDNTIKAEALMTACNVKNGNVNLSKDTKAMIGISSAVTVGTMCVGTAFGASDFFSKAQSIASDLYGKVLGISTILAVLFIAVALVIAFFSPSPKSTEKAVGWIKKIVICWIALNLLGSIFKYGELLTQGGQYKA